MTQALRHFLVDDGYASGKEFCTALLRTGEFNLATLRRYGATTNDKESAAAAVAEKLAAGRVNIDELFLDFCMVPRQWLYFAQPEKQFSDPDPQHSPLSFFQQFGSAKSWHGPVSSPDGRSWLAYTTAIKHLVESAEVAGESMLVRPTLLEQRRECSPNRRATMPANAHRKDASAVQEQDRGCRAPTGALRKGEITLRLPPGD